MNKFISGTKETGYSSRVQLSGPLLATTAPSGLLTDRIKSTGDKVMIGCKYLALASKFMWAMLKPSAASMVQAWPISLWMVIGPALAQPLPLKKSLILLPSLQLPLPQLEKFTICLDWDLQEFGRRLMANWKTSVSQRTTLLELIQSTGSTGSPSSNEWIEISFKFSLLLFEASNYLIKHSHLQMMSLSL